MEASTLKYGKIHYTIKWDGIWLTLSVHLSMPVAATTMKLGVLRVALENCCNRVWHPLIHNIF